MNNAHRVERGLVLRATAYKDADVMLTILTECSGKLSCIARGARRKGSRVAAAIEPLSFSEFTLYSSGSNFSLNEAEPIELFYNLRTDLDALTLGNYFAEIVERASDAEFSDPHVLRLILNALYALSRKTAPYALVKAAFELKIACLSGYQPEVYTCSVCGCPVLRGRFSISSSTICCEACGGGGTPVDAGVVEAMRYVIAADIKRVFSFKLGEAALDAMGSITEAYLKHHFDCEFKSLNLYNTIKE